MNLSDRSNDRKYRWCYENQDAHKICTLWLSEHQIYSIAYAQYNNAFLRVMILSPDICPCMTKKTIDKHIKQLIQLIDGNDAMFSCSIQNYFFTLFAGELQCQILN